MKKNVNLFCAAALMSALCAGFSEIRAQTVWDYPIKPGTPQWDTLETHDQMVKAIQIPDEVLNSLSTEELVNVCLGYPLYGDMFAYNSVQDGFITNVAVNSNGIQELFRRSDNVQYLLNELKEKDLLTFESQEYLLADLEIGEFNWKLSFLEAIMSHESVLTNANAEQRREIAAISVKNLLLKERGASFIYGIQGLESSAYLLGSTLKMANAINTPTPDLERFLRTGSAMNVAVLVEELIGNYVKF